MKILINALSGIGDAVMFSPALSVLKKHLPDAKIEMMVMFKAVQTIYENNPAIDKVHFVDFLNQSSFKSFKQVLALRKNRYDASINVYPSNRREYNIVNFLLGAKKKIAIKYLHSSFTFLEFLNNCKAQEVKDRHNAVENLELIKFLVPDAIENELGTNEVYLSEEEKLFAKNYIEENGLTGKILAGFHAGSATFKGHINKRWAAHKFAELAIKLNKEFDVKVLLFGTEKDVNDNIVSKSTDVSLFPVESNIMQSIALMKKCSLFVCNDAALMHIASALQVPVVAIFGYTNYCELRPWESKHIVVRKELECSPCFYNSPKPVKCIYSDIEEFKCIKTISVDEVFKACKELLSL